MNFKRYSLEQLFMLFFFIIFSLILSFLIFKSANVYDNIDSSNRVHENVRIARSYLFISVKSADISGAIKVKHENGVDLLCIENKVEGFTRYIFFYDGFLRECYSADKFDLGLSEKIVALTKFDVQVDSNQLHYDIEYNEANAKGHIVLRTEF